MLKRSTDRKVANAVNKAGTLATIKNAFGLPSGRDYSCPGATDTCGRVCYAGRIEVAYTSVMSVLLHNWEQLVDASAKDMVTLLDDMIIEFVQECEGKAAPKKFRIHWDGDFFSRQYARAWAIVITKHPDVQFWAYTRSYTTRVNVVPILTELPNLTLYLSVDRDNVRRAAQIRKTYPTVLWAWLDETMIDGKAALPDAYTCPENGGRIPLISPKGSACVRCGICVDGRGDVLFSIQKSHYERKA